MTAITQQSQDMKESYHGVVVPIITPVTSQGEIDEPAVCRVIDYLLAAGVHGIFVLGTTGEALSLSQPMRSRLVSVTVEHVGDRGMVYAGISRNCLTDSVTASQEYFQLGVDVVVAHLPSYYPIDADEQREYYLTLAEKVSGPLMLYNIPITTHLSIPIEVVEELSNHPRIIGLKDSEKDPARLEEIMKRLGGRGDFSIFVGVSVLSAKILGLGANGIVPSPGNLVPQVCVNVYENCKQNNMAVAETYQQQMNAAAAIYQSGRMLGQSLAALKAAMGVLELCGPDVMPPLRALDNSQQDAVRRQFMAWQATQES